MILQIIPCSSELYARFKQGDGEFQSRVICLALVEEKEGSEIYRRVVGMDWCEGEISSVETNANFLGYSDKQDNNQTKQ
jgi:hypothetical protein